MKLNHIAIKVSNIEKSTQFYQEILGCNLIDKKELHNKTVIRLDCEGSVIELIQSEKSLEKTTGFVDHLAFSVKNIDSSFAELKKQNVKLLMENPIPFRDGKIIFFEGPDGERFEFCQFEQSDV